MRSVALVIFDCDGVLIDSEGVASAVVARSLSALGWAMTTDEAMARFVGMSIADMEPMIAARLGRALPVGWRDGLAAALVAALGEEARVVPGAREALLAVQAMGLPWRVASNSSDDEMAVKFRRTGLAGLVEGRCHSAASVIAQGGRAKPAPDVYLAAAAAEGVAPGACVVLEDSVVGVRAAVAAGMRVYGFAPHGDGAILLDVGAAGVVRDLPGFVALLEGL
jgi:beta-phosphoglucomutase-like phosphatase (HAD superfamily)